MEEMMTSRAFPRDEFPSVRLRRLDETQRAVAHARLRAGWGSKAGEHHLRDVPFGV